MSALDSSVKRIVTEEPLVVHWHCGECGEDRENSILHYSIVHIGNEKRSIQLVLKCAQCGLAYHFEGIGRKRFTINLLQVIPPGYARRQRQRIPESRRPRERQTQEIGIIETPIAVQEHNEKMNADAEAKAANPIYRKLRI